MRSELDLNHRGMIRQRFHAEKALADADLPRPAHRVSHSQQHRLIPVEPSPQRRLLAQGWHLQYHRQNRVLAESLQDHTWERAQSLSPLFLMLSARVNHYYQAVH